MRISTTTAYGMLAVGYVAQNKGQKLVISQEIAKNYNIPLQYLLKIARLSVVETALPIVQILDLNLRIDPKDRLSRIGRRPSKNQQID